MWIGNNIKSNILQSIVACGLKTYLIQGATTSYWAKCLQPLVIGHTGYCPMGTLVSCKVDPQQSASFNPLFTQGSSLSPSLPYCVQANHRSLSNCSPVI